MTPKEKVLKELQEFHECFYDESKSNTAELKRKRIEEYIEKSYQAIYELNEEKLAVMDELETLKRYPTADEVCEAIQEEYKIEKVLYDNGRFYDEEDGETLVRQFNYDGKINIDVHDFIFSVDTLIKICRFYEGLEKEK